MSTHQIIITLNEETHEFWVEITDLPLNEADKEKRAIKVLKLALSGLIQLGAEIESGARENLYKTTN